MIEMKGQTEDLDIVLMAVEHLDEVLEIERDSFATPWSREGFRREITDPSHSFSIVAQKDGHVIGYGVSWFVADEMYIANIAVRRADRKKGIGNVLLQILLDKGLNHGCQLATLEVRQSNCEAIELYTKFGFSAVAWRKGYYRDTGEDAVVMMKNLEPETQTQSRQDLVYNVERRTR